MRIHSGLGTLALACASLSLTAACDEVPTSSHHGGVTIAELEAAAKKSPELNKVLAQLKRVTAKYHRFDVAERDDFVPLGCIDERVVEDVAAADERGMGYHFGRLDRLFIGGNPANGGDTHVDILEPDILVYAKQKNSGKMQLAGFDYFVPVVTPPGPPTPPTGSTAPVLPEIGIPFTWSPAHGGWMFHIWSWKNNPDGLIANFNAKVPICDCVLDELEFSCTPA